MTARLAGLRYATAVSIMAVVENLSLVFACYEYADGIMTQHTCIINLAQWYVTCSFDIGIWKVNRYFP